MTYARIVSGWQAKNTERRWGSRNTKGQAGIVAKLVFRHAHRIVQRDSVDTFELGDDVGGFRPGPDLSEGCVQIRIGLAYTPQCHDQDLAPSLDLDLHVLLARAGARSCPGAMFARGKARVATKGSSKALRRPKTDGHCGLCHACIARVE